MTISYTPESPDNKAIRELRDSVKDLNESTRINNVIMIVFTLILVAIAAYSFIELVTIQIPLAKLGAQKEILNVIKSCEINPDVKWVDPDGKVHGCSEMPKEWLQK